MIISTTTPNFDSAWRAMRECSYPVVQVRVLALRDDGRGEYEKLIDIGEFEVAAIATRSGRPRAAVTNWFKTQPADATFVVAGVDDEWDVDERD